MTETVDLIKMLESSGALLRGHFELSSGLHSGKYFQCALLLQDPKRAECAGRLLADKTGNLRWHIDYFLVNSNVSIIDTITINNNRKNECKISKKIEKIADTSIDDFGSSDCNCKSHFHYFKEKKR